MIEAYKHVKGACSIDTLYIKLTDIGNRGHEFKLKKERAAKTIGLTFSLRIDNIWNIKSFKARLDSVLV